MLTSRCATSNGTAPTGRLVQSTTNQYFNKSKSLDFFTQVKVKVLSEKVT